MLLGGLHYCANELVELDPAYKERMAGINAVTQWKSVPDGPNTYTIFKDGKVEFNDDGIHENPDFTMICKDLDLGLEIFKGRNPIDDAIKNNQIEVIGSKDELLKITFYLMEFIPLIGELSGVKIPSDIDVELKQTMQMKALFYYVGRGLEVVSRSNEDFQEEFEDLDGIFQWNVGKVRMYLEANEGIFDMNLDSVHDDPAVTFEVADFDRAVQILKGEIDGTAAYMSGDLNIVGDIQMGVKFASVSEILVQELSDLIS